MFCSGQLQASLHFNINLLSYNFVLEYSETFKGLSKVTQLALKSQMVWHDNAVNYSGWIGPKKGDKSSRGKNLETTSIYHFLQVTNSLDSLKINGEALATTATSGNNQRRSFL